MIFGFTGKKHAGKTTAREYVEEQLADSVRINFKDALIEELNENFKEVLDECSTLYNMDINELFRVKPPIVRALMRAYGTELRRREDPDHWLRSWKRKAEKAYTKVDVLVDDVRFLNEAEAVRELGGIIIRIERSDMPSTDRHASEAEMDEIEPDYMVSCETGDFEAMQEQLDAILNDDL